jgi:hypothetical protein
MLMAGDNTFGLDAMDDLLKNEEILTLAYQLNASLLRRGLSIWTVVRH